MRIRPLVRGAPQNFAAVVRGITPNTLVRDLKLQIIANPSLLPTVSGKAPGDLGLRAGQKALAAAGIEAAEAELANGRVAMLAVVAYVLQEFFATSSGIPEPVVSLSYGLFHPFV